MEVKVYFSYAHLCIHLSTWTQVNTRQNEPGAVTALYSLSKTTKLLLLDSLLQEVCISSGSDGSLTWVSGWVSVLVSHKLISSGLKRALYKLWTITDNKSEDKDFCTHCSTTLPFAAPRRDETQTVGLLYGGGVQSAADRCLWAKGFEYRNCFWAGECTWTAVYSWEACLKQINGGKSVFFICSLMYSLVNLDPGEYKTERTRSCYSPIFLV